QRAILGRVIDSKNAIYCNHNCGPTFGGDPASLLFQTFRDNPTLGDNYYSPIFSTTSGHDLYASSGSNKWQFCVCSYHNIGIPSSFEIADYEVFQVIKNYRNE
ncbi:6780_t:CDS:1, partial [Gigaspora rosea]